MASFELTTLELEIELFEPIHQADPAGALSLVYAEALQSLLPPGMAWSWPQGGIGRRILLGTGEEFARVGVLIEKLLDETDPNKTHELLPEWEAMLALPDPCLQGVVQDEEERRDAIVDKLDGNRSFTAQYIPTWANAMGFTATVVTRKVCRAGSMLAGDPCYSPAWAFFFAVSVLDPGAGAPAVLVCALAEQTPAHTSSFAWNGTFTARPADILVEVLPATSIV